MKHFPARQYIFGVVALLAVVTGLCLIWGCAPMRPVEPNSTWANFLWDIGGCPPSNPNGCVQTSYYPPPSLGPSPQIGPTCIVNGPVIACR